MNKNNRLIKLLYKIPVIKTTLNYLDMIENSAKTILILSEIVTKHDEILKKFDNLQQILTSELNVYNKINEQQNRIDFRKIN